MLIIFTAVIILLNSNHIVYPEYKADKSINTSK